MTCQVLDMEQVTEALRDPRAHWTPMTECTIKRTNPCRKEVGVFVRHLQLKKRF